MTERYLDVFARILSLHPENFACGLPDMFMELVKRGGLVIFHCLCKLRLLDGSSACKPCIAKLYTAQ